MSLNHSVTLSCQENLGTRYLNFPAGNTEAEMKVFSQQWATWRHNLYRWLSHKRPLQKAFEVKGTHLIEWAKLSFFFCFFFSFFKGTYCIAVFCLEWLLCNWFVLICVVFHLPVCSFAMILISVLVFLSLKLCVNHSSHLPGHLESYHHV